MKFFRKHGPGENPVANEREYERIRVVLNVLCRQQGRDLNLFTDDVSEAGMRFISQQEVRPDENVVLTVHLQAGHAPVNLGGRVVWVRQEGESQFIGGIAFVDLDERARTLWLDFIRRNRK